MKRSEIPVLPGWLTLPQAASALGVTRQGVHRLIENESLKTIHRLGDTVKPIYVIKVSEVEQLVKAKRERTVKADQLASG